MDIQTSDKTAKIRQLNDLLRSTFIGGLVVCTSSVAETDEDTRRCLMREVQNFNNFSEDNNPHGENDFGAIDLQGEKFFFKIDYYDKSMEMGSPDPADPSVTRRVITIMRADEY